MSASSPQTPPKAISPEFKKAAIDMMTAQGAIVGWAATVDQIVEALDD